MQKTIILVSDVFEARQAVKNYSKDTVIFALSISAELFLEENVPEYKNPLYKFVDLQDYKYGLEKFVRNFSSARTWYFDEHYQYIANKLGYLLLDLEFNLDFAARVIKSLKPQKIVLAMDNEPKNFSIASGSEMKNAFLILAKDRGLSVNFLKTSKNKRSLRKVAGNILKKLGKRKKLEANGSFDVLFVVPPLKLIDLADFIREIEKAHISIVCVTYNLTMTTKRLIDSLKIPYFEKESFFDTEIKVKARKDFARIKNKKEWLKFNHSKVSLVNKHIRKSIREMGELEMGEIIMDEHISKKIIASVKPKLLLSITDPDRRCLVFINEANKTKIKTLSIEHGADFDLIPYSLPQSTKYITWSKLSKKRLIANRYTNYKKALESSRIVIGQSPFHTYLQKRNKFKKRKLKVLFLATINFFGFGLNFYYLHMLFSSLKKLHPPLEIFVRHHPFQKDSTFLNLANRKDLKISILNNVSLSQSIIMTDVVIFENTTAAFDALLMGKPSIFFNPYSGQDFFNIGKRRIAEVILSGDEIESKINKFMKENEYWKIYSKNAHKFALDYLGIQNSDKFKRLVKIIQNEIS